MGLLQQIQEANKKAEMHKKYASISKEEIEAALADVMYSKSTQSPMKMHIMFPNEAAAKQWRKDLHEAMKRQVSSLPPALVFTSPKEKLMQMLSSKIKVNNMVDRLLNR